MATTAALPFSCSTTLQTLTRTLYPRHPLLIPRRRFHHLRSLAAAPGRPNPPRLSRPISASAATNGSSSAAEYDYDLFTIGAGSGGVRASRFATTLFGARAAICEMPFATISADDLGGVGGTCVLRGCVPKKLLVYASKFSHEFEESHGFGWNYETAPKHDWSTLIANKNTELQRLVGIYKNILNNAGVDLIEGRGKVVDPHTVSVDASCTLLRTYL